MGATLSDFWWLNDDQLNRFIYLLLDHREPEDDLELPTKRVNKCRISSIDEFRNKHKNINVYRGLELSDSQ
jgi:hypothetical protein